MPPPFARPLEADRLEPEAHAVGVRVDAEAARGERRRRRPRSDSPGSACGPRITSTSHVAGVVRDVAERGPGGLGAGGAARARARRRGGAHGPRSPPSPAKVYVAREPKISGTSMPAGDGQVGPEARALGHPHAQLRPGRHAAGSHSGSGSPSTRRGHRRAAEGDGHVAVGGRAQAAERQLEPRRPRRRSRPGDWPRGTRSGPSGRPATRRRPSGRRVPGSPARSSADRRR